MWFFIVSVGAHYTCIGHGRLSFAMTWYSFVFPNTAMVTSTFAIGRAFESLVVEIIGCVFAGILVAAWFIVFGMNIRAVIRKDILWPQTGEDRCEGGFECGDDQCEFCHEKLEEKLENDAKGESSKESRRDSQETLTV